MRTFSYYSIWYEGVTLKMTRDESHQLEIAASKPIMYALAYGR